MANVQGGERLLRRHALTFAPGVRKRGGIELYAQVRQLLFIHHSLSGGKLSVDGEAAGGGGEQAGGLPEVTRSIGLMRQSQQAAPGDVAGIESSREREAVAVEGDGLVMLTPRLGNFPLNR